MNQDILDKAHELAELISASEEFQRMRDLETEASADPEVSDLYASYADLRDRMSAQAMEEAGAEDLEALRGEILTVERALEGHEKMREVTKARAAFNLLMEGVNRQLQSVLAGDEPEDWEDGEGCGSGGCAGCQGCGPR